jgi:hypothetical protein
MWLGHWFPAAAPWLFLLVVAYQISLFWLPDHGVPHNAAAGAGRVAAALFVLMLLCRDRVHARNMCVLDQGASRVLLDPQGEVKKRARLLKFHHRRTTWLVRAGGFTQIFLVLYAGKSQLPLAVKTAASVLEAACFAVLTYAMRAFIVHQRLQTWCPDCDHGGGGENTVVPDPVPSGTVN